MCICNLKLDIISSEEAVIIWKLKKTEKHYWTL